MSVPNAMSVGISLRKINGKLEVTATATRRGVTKAYVAERRVDSTAEYDMRSVFAACLLEIHERLKWEYQHNEPLTGTAVPYSGYGVVEDLNAHKKKGDVSRFELEGE